MAQTGALLAVGLLSVLLARGVAADCFVGGIAYQEGDSIGERTMDTCIGGSEYEGTASVCTNGEVVETNVSGTCRGTVKPNCIQCGPPGQRSAAICLSQPDTVPSTCSQAALPTCMISTSILTQGQVADITPATCTGGSTFEGTARTCTDGKLVSSPSSGTCKPHTPHCVQCEDGQAMCLTSPELPRSCDGPSQPATGCLVGDIMHQHGDSVGVIGDTCAGNSSWNGTQSFCRNGEVVGEPHEEECSGSTPFCVQCGKRGAWGAALCLGSPEVPDHCSDNMEEGIFDKAEQSIEGFVKSFESSSASLHCVLLLPVASALVALAASPTLLL
mmetsp:Transcript_6171/g.17235  ORF Transcript_6171/g.17235 Transcript_6171/m.17235 type:complete len:330 (-) Transcript_6171:485-1474(-)